MLVLEEEAHVIPVTKLNAIAAVGKADEVHRVMTIFERPRCDGLVLR